MPRKSELLGSAIVVKGGGITRVNSKLFLVSSLNTAPASTNIAYSVRWDNNRWDCECPGFIQSKRKRSCEHIFAVNYLLKLPQIILANSAALEGACPHCRSNDIILKDWRYNKSGAVRRCLCKECGRKFKSSVSREDIDKNIALWLISIDLYYRGLSTRQISDHLLQIYNIDKSHATVHNWILKFTNLIQNGTKDISFPIGTKWLADEMVIKIRGKKKYLWNIMDYETRIHIISMLLDGRGSEEASKAIDGAIKRANKRPKEVITDGLESYRKPLAEKGIKHTSNVALADKAKNNNRIERLHGSVRAFVRSKRGLKGRASELLRGHQVFYNSIRSHSAVAGMTPINGSSNKWLSLLSDKNDVKKPRH